MPAPIPESSDANRCFHCGEDIPRGVNLSVERAEDFSPDKSRVCCHGCKAVAELIYHGGLGRYYRFRQAHGIRSTDDLTRLELAWQAIDSRSDLWGRSLGDGRHEVLLQTEGIRCAACAWLIRSHLERLPGVDAVNVDTASGYTRIDWQPDEVTLSRLAGALMEIGYKPHIPVASIEEQARQAERRQSLKRVGVAGLGMMQVMMYAVGLYAGENGDMNPAIRSFLEWVSLLVTLPVLLYSGQTFFYGAYNSLKAGRPGMDVPVALAISLAFLASCYNFFLGGGTVWFDSVVMFIFFLSLGRHLELTLRHRNLQTGAALARLLPEWAERSDGDQWSMVPGMDLKPGDRVRVGAGQSFPADGKLESSVARVNESLLTGESCAVVRCKDDNVVAGSINLEQSVVFEVTAAGPDTTVSSLGRTVLAAQTGRPSQSAGRIRQGGLPHWLVPAFILTVLVLATMTWAGWNLIDPEQAFPAMLAVLVASCPCALSLALPATIAAASRGLLDQGILLTSSDGLARLHNIDSVIFDKTGTLTSGEMTVRSTVLNKERSGFTENEALYIAAMLESASTHPIASAFKQITPLPSDAEDMGEIERVAGQGVEGYWRGQRWRLGCASFAGQTPENNKQWDADIWLADEEGWRAKFQLGETLRDDAPNLIAALQAREINIEILSGDGFASVSVIANALAIERHYARQSANDKLNRVQLLQQQGHQVLVVGDGVNDAPVLAAADVSMTVKGGADLAHSVADFILLTDSLGLADAAMEMANKTRLRFRQNLAWALLYNAAVMPLAVMGLLQPWMAALGMSLSSLVVVANAARLTRS